MGAGQKVIKSKPKTFGKYIDKGQVGISVHSSTMVDDLSTFGVVPRKSKTASVKILEFNPHFWRGVIDGDGCIGMMRKEYPTLELVGSEQLCRQFSEFVKNIFPKTKANVRFHKNIYKFGVVGKAALAVINALYGDPDVTALDRKMEHAQEILHATTTRLTRRRACVMTRPNQGEKPCLVFSRRLSVFWWRVSRSIWRSRLPLRYGVIRLRRSYCFLAERIYTFTWLYHETFTSSLTYDDDLRAAVPEYKQGRDDVRPTSRTDITSYRRCKRNQYASI